MLVDSRPPFIHNRARLLAAFPERFKYAPDRTRNDGRVFREAAVLVLVFVPIVKFLERGEPLTFGNFLIIVITGGGLLALGIAIEVMRE